MVKLIDKRTAFDRIPADGLVQALFTTIKRHFINLRNGKMNVSL